MSGGTWTQSDARNTSTRPGVYINFLSQAQEAIQAGAQGVVAIIGTADWGQVDDITSLTSEAQVDTAVGTGGTLNLLARQALRGGASEVKAYRIATGAADSASITLVDATGSPVNAATLTAKYPGDRANGFSVTVAVNASNVDKKDVTISENGSALEVFTVSDNDDLVAQISGDVSGVNGSSLVTAVIDGSSNRTLGNLSATTMSGGNSGSSVTSTQFTNAMSALEVLDWNMLIPSSTTNTSIQAAVRAYVARLRNEGKKVVAVMGGQSVSGMSSNDLASEFSDMKANASDPSTGDHEGVIMVFPGIVDETSGQALSGAETAARVAGMIGRAGFNSSITKQTTGATQVTARLTNADIKAGLQAGLLLITMQGDQALVEQGINTLSSFTATKSRDFRKIRVVRALDAVAQTIDTSLNASAIGTASNDVAGRSWVRSLVRQALELFQQAGAIEAGYTIADSSIQGDSDEYYLDISLTPIDSIEKVFITARVL
jgi:hypothetical protein